MIIDKYSSTVYNLALSFVRNKEDASDITQDIFIKVYNNIDKFIDERNFNSWILRISKNYCIDYWRKNKKNFNREDFDENQHKNEQTPEKISIQEFDASVLRKRLLGLDPDLRLLLTLRDIQGKSYQEISEDLNLPLGTVKSRINRARIKLAKTFFARGS